MSGRLAGILTVEEKTIVLAMRLLWERAKLLVEPSGAVSLAAVLAHSERFECGRVGLFLTGGNTNLDELPC